MVKQIEDLSKYLEGAAQYLMSYSEDQKAFLQDFFIKIKNMCTADLPRELPPDRGLGDDHQIEILPGSKPTIKPPYKQSPAEQLLIKQ